MRGGGGENSEVRPAIGAGLAAAAFRRGPGWPQLRARRSGSAVTLLPYAGVLVGACLLIAVAVRDVDRHTRIGVTIGSVLLTILVVLRQIVVLRVNHQLATTDPLTGLANRTRLNEVLGLADSGRYLRLSVRNHPTGGVSHGRPQAADVAQ